MKVKKAVSLYNGLQKCLPLTGVKLAYAIARTMKNIEPIVESYGVVQKQLMQEYGEKDKEGNFIFTGPNSIKLIAGKEQEYEEKMTEALEVDEKLNIFTITETDIPKGVSAEQMLSLVELIKFEEKKEVKK